MLVLSFKGFVRYWHALARSGLNIAFAYVDELEGRQFTQNSGFGPRKGQPYSHFEIIFLLEV